MKDAVKLSGILFSGLLTAVVIYPFLHESGHSAAAILLDANVLEFNLFPLPNVWCNIADISKFARISVGLGGIIFPIVISSVMSLVCRNNFWIKYIAFLLNGINLLAAVISFVAVIMFNTKNPMENEDVTQILQMYPDSGSFIIALIIFLMIYLTSIIILAEPIKNCLAYFGLEDSKKSDTV